MRLRIRFAKQGKVRWTSHRDVARIWERAFRRVSVPLAYTGGFSPRPRVSFGLALPTGYESEAEYLDVELSGDVDRDGVAVDVASLPARFDGALPDGMEVMAAAVVDDRADSLQQAVTCCTWRIELPRLDPAIAAGLVDRALAAPALVLQRERKGQTQTDDVRPAIRALTVVGSPPGTDGTLLDADLATQPRGLRPAELLAVLAPGLPADEARARRLHQWIERDGAREEPLPLPPRAASAPHEGLRPAVGAAAGAS